LGRYLAGEFDNQQQAIADPAWYVHLRLWQRPIPLFIEDSITLFAEQANIVNLDHPYRPRILRLRGSDTSPEQLQVQYYMIKDLEAVRGAGRNLELLKSLTPTQMELLPSCTLTVTQHQLDPNNYHFSTSPASQEPCRFSYQSETYQVFLGFDATPNEFKTYDKGIDPSTGKALWGAIMGPYRYTKRQDFSSELPI
jgi:hypothetical protein